MNSTYALYRVEEVELFLTDHPKGFDFKQGHELLAGCVLARCSMAGGEQHVGVGFRLSVKEPLHAMERPSLDELLAKYRIDDRDIDIIIGNDDWQSAFQVTRIEERGKGASPSERLMTVLRKKMLIQPDPLLQLAILADETFELSYENLHEYLLQRSVPYGRVCLIAQTGEFPKLGRFQCLEVYPGLGTSEEVQLDLIGEK